MRIIIVLIIIILALAGLFYINRNSGVSFSDLLHGSRTNYQKSQGSTARETGVKLAISEKVGGYLTDGKGMALYVFSDDKRLESTCYGTCAEKWPPFIYDHKQIASSSDTLTKKLNVIKRTDGTYQYAYGTEPIYHYVMDKNPGDTLGDGQGGKWQVIKILQ